MTEQDGLAQHEVDFDAYYRGEPPAPGMPALPVVPWDSRKPQSLVVELERDGRFSGEVLDVGCGLGDNATYLADQGYRVHAIDISPTAVRQAEERATGRPGAEPVGGRTEAGGFVRFAVEDARTLSAYADGSFDTVLDCTLYHCLADDQRRDYLSVLRRVTRPGGRLNMLCFSTDLPDGPMSAWRIGEDELRGDLTATDWRITDFRAGAIRGADFSGDQAEMFGRILGVDLAAGHLRLPVWVVSALRA